MEKRKSNCWWLDLTLLEKQQFYTSLNSEKLKPFYPQLVGNYGFSAVHFIPASFRLLLLLMHSFLESSFYGRIVVAQRVFLKLSHALETEIAETCKSAGFWKIYILSCEVRVCRPLTHNQFLHICLLAKTWRKIIFSCVILLETFLFVSLQQLVYTCM